MNLKTLLVALALTFGLSCSALARNGYDYPHTTNDAKSGNTYSTDGHGGTSDYNTNTGSHWNSNSSGSYTSGTDAKGNSWSYDRSTGIYQKSGTGEVRQHGKPAW